MVDYYSFDEVIKQLELDEEELKRMVSEGELRAFRDENKIRFRKEDVDNLKSGKITEPTIILPAGSPTPPPIDLPSEDIDLGGVTGEVPTETLQLDNIDISEEPKSASDTFIEEDTGLSTEPLKLADEDDTGSTVTVDAFETVTEDATVTLSSKAPRGKPVAAVPYAIEEEIERARPHWIWTVFTVLTLIVVMYMACFLYDSMRMNLTKTAYGVTDQPMGMTRSLADYWLNQFWNDPEWKKIHESEYAVDKTVREQNSRPYEGPTYMEPDMPKPKAAAQP